MDDETWLHHLRRCDYSSGLRESLKDDELAGHVEEIERQADHSAAESRAAIRRAIEERYTAAAQPAAEKGPDRPGGLSPSDRKLLILRCTATA